MLHNSLAILSAKLCAALLGAVVSFFSLPFFASIDPSTFKFAEYGILGIVCGFLLYGLRVFHNINQKLHEGWRKSMEDAERARIADHMAYYEKMEEHVVNGTRSRQELIEATNKQTRAFEELSKHIKQIQHK